MALNGRKSAQNSRCQLSSFYSLASLRLDSGDGEAFRWLSMIVTCSRQLEEPLGCDGLIVGCRILPDSGNLF